MSKKDEALKLALEALEELRMLGMNAQWHDSWLAKPNEAIAAIREALAEQPAQQQELEELVTQRDQLADILTRTANALKGKPAELLRHSWHDLPEVAQQLKAAQQQGPVAWITKNGKGWLRWHKPEDSKKNKDSIPLYTSPPASKPWVGLTDEEVDECYYWKDRLWTTDELVRHVEAKLREKNT